MSRKPRRAQPQPPSTSKPLAAALPERWVSIVPAALVVLACLFNLAAFHTELNGAAYSLNDHVLHQALAARMDAAWQAHANPLDPWIPYWGQGFPVLRYYQNLPHLLVVSAYRLLGRTVPLADVFRTFHLLCLVLMPASFYLGARRLGLERPTAALTALCVPLLAVDPTHRHFLGLQPASFIWNGGGLFSQEVAVAFLPLALAAVLRSALTGRCFGAALALLWATWVSHLLIGYSACLLGLLAIVHPDARGQRRAVLLRLLGIYAGVLAAALYLIWPTLMESNLLWRSVWEERPYWDSYGAPMIIQSLLCGGILDGPRIPVLTLLAGLGAASVVSRRWRPAAELGAARFALGAAGLSLLLFFGRATWGPLVKLLPMSDNLPFHRFICAVQYSGLLLAGLGLSVLWRALDWRRDGRRLALALAVTAAALSPAFWSAASTGQRLAGMTARTAAEFSGKGKGVVELMAMLSDKNRAEPGRGYAGTRWDWGREYHVGSVPLYMLWPAFDIPSISYMMHTMGINSDLDVEFDPKRKDHYDLFNIRYLLLPREVPPPPFARVLDTRPGVVAAVVDTPGYFDVVQADWFYPLSAASPRQRYAFSKRFIASSWHGAKRFVRMGRDWRDGPQGSEILLRPGAPMPDRPDSNRRPAPAASEVPQVPDGRTSLRPAPGRVLRSWGSNDRFGAVLEADEAAYALVRVTFHPAWRALVDGAPARTVMLSPAYLGIPLSPGRHTVEVSYAPGWRSLVFFVLGLGLIGLALLADRLGLWPAARALRRPTSC